MKRRTMPQMPQVPESDSDSDSADAALCEAAAAVDDANASEAAKAADALPESSDECETPEPISKCKTEPRAEAIAAAEAALNSAAEILANMKCYVEKCDLDCHTDQADCAKTPCDNKSYAAANSSTEKSATTDCAAKDCAAKDCTAKIDCETKKCSCINIKETCYCT